MNNRGNINLGDEIKNIVQDALNNKDFNKLNRDIENVVKGALDEVRRSIKGKQGNQNNFNNQTRVSKTSQNDISIKSKPTLNTTKFTVPMGQVSGVLLTIFGSIGSIAFGIAVFVLTLLGFSLGNLFHTIAIGLLPLFIISMMLLMKGNSNRKRLKRFQKYILYLKGRDYLLINDLSSATGLNNKFIEKDLRKMIKTGMFPEGHIDDKKTTFILTDECYGQYLELQKDIEMKNLDKIQRQKIDQSFESEKQTSRNVLLTPEVRKSINEGRRFVIEIKDANILIPREEISYKLERLEEITGKIFDYVEIHPEKFTEIKKFTEYFLPTTLKLVNAYKKLDYQSVQGENISNAKKEIEQTMDTIILAFENLFDDLFQDMAMDISTDISVLETMLAQEGLTNNNMRVKK